MLKRKNQQDTTLINNRKTRRDVAQLNKRVDVVERRQRLQLSTSAALLRRIRALEDKR